LDLDEFQKEHYVYIASRGHIKELKRIDNIFNCCSKITNEMKNEAFIEIMESNHAKEVIISVVNILYSPKSNLID
jgi:hypothetical protein